MLRGPPDETTRMSPICGQPDSRGDTARADR